eukprot:6107937-Ditylum_brightwellii.AAC.1
MCHDVSSLQSPHRAVAGSQALRHEGRQIDAAHSLQHEHAGVHRGAGVWRPASERGSRTADSERRGAGGRQGPERQSYRLQGAQNPRGARH